LISLRARLWTFLIKRWRDKVGDIKNAKDIRQGDGNDIEIYTNNSWKKQKEITFTDLSIGNIDILRLDNKNTKNNKTLLYLHGGGYVACGPETHGPLITKLSLYSQANVFFPIYRLAPEHPYPAAIEDALLSYRYLLDQGIKSEEIFVAGDSAGGGLSMALLQKIKEENLSEPACAILISPWTDLTLSGNSLHERVERDPLLKPGPSMNIIVDAYCAGEDPKNPLISSIFGDLQDMPPIQIQVGSEEIIYDDSLRLFNRLKEYQNHSIEFLEWEGLFHVFQAFCSGWLAIPEAKKSIKKMAQFSDKFI